MSEVTLDNVVKSYGPVNVIKGIDLEIKSGEFVVFVGPSGCGKSTLLRMIAGLEPITGGRISIGGAVVNDLPPRLRDIAMVFQDYAPDLEAAAMVDGCSRVGALFRVVVPLAAPGVFTAGILAFVNAWDEFLLALTMMNRVSMRTLSVGITLYQGEFAFPWPLISAALIIALVPICIIIAVFQERVVGGLTAGGVKG
jgi:ABC-type oligopeptide transport system ATPase subunit